MIFVDDEDRRVYLRILRGVIQRFGWRVLVYCLMPNHVHLLVETREPNLGRGMHALHGTYAMYFNARYARVGHLFQGRYGARFLYDAQQVAAVFAYIAANPVAASLCKEPEDWEWSSYDAAISVLRDPIADLGRLRDFLHAADTSALGVVHERLVSVGLRAPV